MKMKIIMRGSAGIKSVELITQENKKIEWHAGYSACMQVGDTE